MAAKTLPKTIYPDRQAEHEAALLHLRAAVASPGMLKVITADHACGGGPQPRTPEEREACEAHPASIKHVAHQVLHDVVEIEGPDHKGRVKAHTAQGDWTAGYPADVLRRLLEHMTES